MKINAESSFDYIYEAVLYNQQSSYSQMSDWFNIMMEQATAVLEASSLDVVTEDVAAKAVKTGAKVGKSVKNGVTKFIEFIKNMFNRFLEFVTSLFKNNEKWVLEREKDFSTMNYKGLSISAVPYWEGNAYAMGERILREIGNIVDEYDLIDSAKPLSENELEKALEETDPKNFLEKYATNGDYVDGIKNLMRVNNKDGKDSVELAGDQLKSHIQTFFIPTVKENKKLVEMTKKLFNDNEATLTKIEGAISKRSSEAAKETFLITGERLYSSDASLFMSVTEAEINTNQDNKPDQTNNNSQENKTNSNAKDSTHGSTKVEVNKTSEHDSAVDESINNTSSNLLKITRNYAKCSSIVLAAVLTVMEERMSLSVNVLKAVYNSANTRHGRKGNTEGQEEKK